MKIREDFRVSLIKPTETFGSFAELCRHVPELVNQPDLPSNYFCLPQIAIILAPDGEALWSVSLFLAEVALNSRSLQGDTARTYAEALLPWLRYLRQREINLNEVTEEDFGLFRARVSHAVMSDGEKYASATVNLRVTVPALMHSWGERRGVIYSPLGKYLLDSSKGRLKFPFRGGIYRGVSNRIAPRVTRRLPISLSMEELKRVIALTPQPYRLMMSWCVAASLRRIEVCSLRKSQLPSPEQISLSDGMVSIDMLRKGSRELSVYVPSRLLERTNWYILERPSPAKPQYECMVFLTERGYPVSRQMLSREFRIAANRMGSRATLHHLRHTFAVHTLGIIQKRSEAGEELNPLKIVQILLGHASVETTEIYTAAIGAMSPAVMEALDYLFGATDR